MSFKIALMDNAYELSPVARYVYLLEVTCGTSGIEPLFNFKLVCVDDYDAQYIAISSLWATQPILVIGIGFVRGYSLPVSRKS